MPEQTSLPSVAHAGRQAIGRLGAWRTACLATTLLPAVLYLSFEYADARRLVARDALIQATIADDFMACNPEVLRDAGDSLLERIARIRAAGSEIRLLDSNGTELRRIGDGQATFPVSASAPFHNAGKPVGSVQVGIDMLPKLTNGALIGLQGLFVGAMALILFRRRVELPLALARDAEWESRVNHGRWLDSLELSAACFWETDAEFRFTGVTGDGTAGDAWPVSLIGRYFWEIDCNWTTEQRVECHAKLEEYRAFEIDFPVASNGCLAWFNIRGKPLFDSDGRFAGYRGIARDVSAQVTLLEHLRIATSTFEMQESIMVMDVRGCLLEVNEAFLAVTGYTAAEIVGQPIAVLKAERNDAAQYRRILATLARGRSWHGELWGRHRSGRHFLCDLSIKAVLSPEGKVEHFVGSFHDITERHEAKSSIHQLAFFDPLTQLPNRRLLFDRLRKAQAASQRTGHHGALMFIDLDDFKTLNDTRGHDVGDMLLCEVAKRLRTIVGAKDSVVRLGGDEFVVLLEQLSRMPDVAAAEANEVGRELFRCLNKPFDLQGQEVHSTPSVGVVLFCGDSQSIEQLLKHADAAMYQSKAAGRNTLHFFDPRMHAALEARAAMEAEMRIALKNGQFRLYYQPQVDANGNIIGAEVLLRWPHPLRGMISPGEFIPLAEDCGLILPLGEWVLDAACTQLKNWAMEMRTEHLTLAVNVSARQYHQADFVERVLNVLDQSGADPRKLKLELTESMLVKDLEDVVTKMSVLKARGVCFSLDDFGTGYSSLSYLKRLPLDQLKIDQSFVRDLERNDNDAVICAATIGLAHHLGLKVVAEGVETEIQRHFLINLHHCDFMQGYLFARPLPLHAFEALLGGRAGACAYS